MCQFWGIVVGDGIPGCSAPMGFIDALTFLRSVKRCHLLDFFFITKIGVFQGEQDSSICFNSNCVSISSLVAWNLKYLFFFLSSTNLFMAGVQDRVGCVSQGHDKS